jgi:molecular chaperone HtpG
MLQQDPAIIAMRSALTKRVLDMLSRLAEKETDKYATFWDQFGSTLKEGLAEDSGNREKIASLLRFRTTRSEKCDRSLDDYLAGLQPNQDKIYYLISDSPAAAAASPHLEAFRDRGIEVLLLTDRIDEWALQYLTEYKGTALKDITRGELELPKSDDEPEVEAEPDKDQKDLLKRIKRSLKEQVEEVRSSHRLRESAACIVLSEHDLGFQMKEMLKAAGQALPETKPNLEVNLDHPFLKRLATETDKDRFGRLARVLFDQAVLTEGRQLDDPAEFVKSLNELLFDA